MRKLLRFSILTLVLASSFAITSPRELAAAGACKYTCEPCFTSAQCPYYFGRPQPCLAYCV